jgi:hypothetical protein
VTVVVNATSGNPTPLWRVLCFLDKSLHRSRPPLSSG